MKKAAVLFTFLSLTLASLLGAPGSVLAQTSPIKGNAASGAQKAAMCLGCHGIEGYKSSFPEVYRVPMIAGQTPGYLTAALKAYQDGSRKHPTMRGIAGSLTPQDIADLAEWFAAQASKTRHPPTTATILKTPSPTVAKLLEKSACQSCHGDNYSKPLDPSYPKLSGQYSDYLFTALKSYKAVDPAGVSGRSNAIMAGIVKDLSNADLKTLAQFLGEDVSSELRVAPTNRIR